MKEFLAQLPAAEEKRLLVLVRSANDSAEDVLGYLECTHGFFPKAPMQQERVCELLAPLWAERFQKSDGDSDDAFGDDASDEILTRQELRLVLHKIDQILTKPIDQVNWKELWSALHSFKGDITTMGSSDEIAYIVSCISSMRGPSTPPGFERTWAQTRCKIVELIGKP